MSQELEIPFAGRDRRATASRSILRIALLLVLAALLLCIPSNLQTSAARDNNLGDVGGAADLGGIYDIQIYASGSTYFTCMAKVDRDSVALSYLGVPYHLVKANVQCNTDKSAYYDPNAEPRVSPIGVGPDSLPGPPPPPPYTTAAPTKLTGSFVPATNTLVLNGCFANVGGTIGPNFIVKMTFGGVTSGLNAGVLQGSMSLYGNAPSANCGSLDTSGLALTLQAQVTFYKAGTGGQAPWRLSGRQSDFDGDGCSDSDELAKMNAPSSCGDDPFNPWDSGSNMTDISGSYNFLATVRAADWAGVLVPGFYFNCLGYLQQSGTGWSAPTVCYVDSPSVVVNPPSIDPANPVQSCPPAQAYYCGDGLPGASPPGSVYDSPVAPRALKGALADVNEAKSTFSGTVDSTTKAITLTGCFQNGDGYAPLGNTYVKIVADGYKGHGNMTIWTSVTSSDCAAQNVPGGPGATAALDLARQSNSPTWDTDGDGCPDYKELQGAAGSQGSGGLRDPLNPYDYFDPSHDGLSRVNDILMVVGQYLKNDNDSTPGQPPYALGYNPDTDRTPLGPNIWNLGPPDGVQIVPDILAELFQYFHDCS